MAKVPKKVADRFVKGVRKFQRVLPNAKDRDINEADTVTIVTDMLEDVFGYDKYTEITSEYAIRGTYCDLAIKIDGEPKYLIEVKAIGLDLKDHHLRQAVNYGANHGIQWVILTNSIDWEIYRIRFEKPISHQLLCSFNFFELNPRTQEDQDRLFILCKEGLSKAAIEEFDEYVRSVNKFVVGTIVQSEAVLNVIRRELRRMSPGVKVDMDELKKMVVNDVLKRDIMEGVPAERAQARFKKASSKALRKRKKKTPEKGVKPPEGVYPLSVPPHHGSE
ncbi:MAG: type I restriction enzyme HsdR N-terminal domain-containing protein [Desulfobacterales bacterium]|nr:MAG: type I restriction enzyme HsdR N-terminal domain-containing protein [Desulfobacterales bacterium]